MATVTERIEVRGDEAAVRVTAAPYQAYQILHWGFVAVPAIAGADKFFHFLTEWNQYLAVQVERILPFSSHAFMLLVGVVELLAAVLVAVRPRIGAYVVFAWLLGIMANLLLAHGYLDIVLRDAGLALAALALGRLAAVYDHSTLATQRKRA